jgi:Domain of unknown function (DUF4365)
LARKKKAPPRKRRTREHVIADLGVNHVERQILLCGYSVERVVHDYGIDLLLFTYNAEGEVERGESRIQVKATEQVQRLATRQTLGFRLARADVQAWLAEAMPVFLVVYDAGTDRAYWLYIQAYFASLPRFNLFRAGASIRVQIPDSQVLNPQAIRLWTHYRDRILQQMDEVVHHDV